MPQIRAEQVLELTLRDLQIADDAAIQQHKIEDWQSDASGWISKGIIKPVTTAELPEWDGTQAGEFYYDINTNELFFGISTAPYYQIIMGSGESGTSALSNKLLVVKMSTESENWTGATVDDLSGTASRFSLDTDDVATDGSNLTVYLNGVLQERGSGNDYILVEEEPRDSNGDIIVGEDPVDKIVFNYNLEGPDQKVTAIINNDTTLVNYATKSYVDQKFFGDTGHNHNGSDSNQLDFNDSMTPDSLAAIIHSIVPETTAVNLGSATNKFGDIYAVSGHFDASTIYIGNVAISTTGDELKMGLGTPESQPSEWYPIAKSGSDTEPAQLTAGSGQPVVLESTVGITAKGDILPDMEGGSNGVSTRDIGSPTQRFANLYADEVHVGASSLYVNGKKVIEDVSDTMTFQTSQDQGMIIKTTALSMGNGTGNLALQSDNEVNMLGYDGVKISVPDNVSGAHVNVVNSSTGGNITLTSDGTSGQIQLNAIDEIDLVAPSVAVNGDMSVTGTITGNITSATKLATARNITLTGDVTGSASFDGTANASITATVVNDSHTHDTRYYTETESDSRFVRKDNTGTETMQGSLVVQGDFTVSGTTTTVNTETIQLADNIITLNSNYTGSTPSEDSGIEVERGTETNYQFMFDEATDTFVIGMVGDLQPVATREVAPSNNAVPIWNNTEKRFDTTSVTISGSNIEGNASTATKLATARNIALTGDVTGSASFDGTANVSITATVGNNSHTHTSANISDATSTNTPNRVVIRDASGDFSAETITASLSGNASTATKLATARNITLTGDVTGSASFDGTANASITATVGNNSHTHTSANISDAASAATANVAVLRDGQGDIRARLFRSEYDSTNSTIGFVMTQVNTENNNFIRPSTTAQLATQMESDNVIVKYNGGSPTAGAFYTGTTDPTNTTRLNYDGYFYATRVYNAVYNDLAEFMPKAEEAEVGMVMVQTENGLAPSNKRGDGAVVGVYSDTFGQALGADDQENKIPVGLAGRVNVWVKEPVKIGDLLISDADGFATVKRSGEDGDGKVIGKVMQNKETADAERISMLIMMK